ncbi:MAG: TetR/AcrR family transcriptional regulator [Gammaproteobacteria bacterium]|nr:TetR/AcrR family transcriptional regulator [Gammaproteobacteria bacterium]
MNDFGSITPKRERILDAAEELFALHGFDGVTLRQIAKKADVDVALANYHFGKKQDLFEAAFLRRAQTLNNLRLQSLLEAQKQKCDDLTVEDIVAAFLRPIQRLALEDEKGWRNYYALVAYVNSSAVWGQMMMHKHFDPLVSRYIEAFRQVFPDTPLERIHWAYHYLSGALTLDAGSNRPDRSAI